jgi:D-sedoheptulose 7-phosphate isomerase
MNQYFEELFIKYPQLSICHNSILSAYQILEDNIINKYGTTLYTCGNGGSAADAEHIVTELMKGFKLTRDVKVLEDMHLQQAIKAVSLTSNTSLITAIANDMHPDLIFAQQLYGYGKSGDVLMALSTSGNSINVIKALLVAIRFGIKTIGLTGYNKGQMEEYCDVCICVPEDDTYGIQELHMPIYHTLCLMLEDMHFNK